MTTQSSFSEMRADFAQFGSRAIEGCGVLKRTSAKPAFMKFEAARIEAGLLPLVAAHFEGLGSLQMAQIVNNCGITMEEFLNGVDYGTGAVLELDGESADFDEFLLKSLKAILIASNLWSRDSVLPEHTVAMIRNCLDKSPRFALAVTLLGREALSFSEYQHDLVARLAEEEVGQEGVVLHSSLLTAFSTHLMVDAWIVDGAYSKGQLCDFLYGSGALDDLTVRNITGQSAFWTNVVYSLSENELCEPLIDLVLSTHPHLALQIVRSFDMEAALRLEGTLRMCDLDTLANSLDCLMKCLERADMGHMLKSVDIMLNFARAGANVHESEDPDENDFIKIMAGFRKAGTPERIFDHIYTGRVDIKDKVSFLGLKVDLTADLMNAQLKTPLDEVTLSQFMHWGFMARYGLIGGARKRKLVTNHLIHMAQAACLFKLQGHEKLLVLRQTYEQLDRCMRDLVQAAGASLDMQSLQAEPAHVRDMLSIWGIDPRVLGINSGKAVDRWIAGDLGL